MRIVVKETKILGGIGKRNDIERESQTWRQNEDFNIIFRF